MKAGFDLKASRRSELFRIAAAYADVSRAFAICEHYQEMLTNWDVKNEGQKIAHPLNYAFMSSIVTAYARPFSDGKIGQLPGRCLKFPQPSMRQFHEKLIEMRHSVYAHSDKSVPLIVYPAGCEVPFRTKPHKGTCSFRRDEFPPSAIVPLWGLCGWMQANLEHEMFALVEEIGADWKQGDPPIEIVAPG